MKTVFSKISLCAVLPNPGAESAEAIPLDRLPRGASARVVAVEAPGALGRRLRDLGFVAGTRVALLRVAPLGDPLLFEVRGAHFALRRSEARWIRVLPS